MQKHSLAFHVTQVLGQGALVALVVVVLVASTALAAKGGNGGHGKLNGGTISGPVMVADADADGVVSSLDDISFNVSTSATDYPQVGLRCYQGTTFVYDAYVGYWATYQWDRFFRLQSDYWNPNLAATCTARLFFNDSRGRQQVLATLDFEVAP